MVGWVGWLPLIHNCLNLKTTFGLPLQDLHTILSVVGRLSHYFKDHSLILLICKLAIMKLWRCGEIEMRFLHLYVFICSKFEILRKFLTTNVIKDRLDHNHAA